MMRLVTYQVKGEERVRVGVMRDDAIVDCSDFIGEGGWRSWFEDGDRAALREYVDAATSQFPQDAVVLLPPVPDPQKILCVGLNYRNHVLETGRELPAHPTLFPRYADTQMGHGRAAIIPEESTWFDYEGELAVVIGKHGRRIGEEEAMEFVAGYAPYNDFSVRDWQRHTSQFLPGKNFPATGGFGPALVTPDEVEDVSSCVLTTTVNGDIRQQAPLSELIFTVPSLISYISTFTPLAPGDVIVTGTPGGVGLFHEPPEFLVDADEVRVDISGVGTLVNPVRAEAGSGGSVAVAPRK